MKNQLKQMGSTQREKDWHNLRFAGGDDTRAKSKTRFAYATCGYATHTFEQLQKVEGKRVLDIGCGRGIRRAHKFTGMGCQYTGVDISEECIDANNADCASTGMNATFVCDDAHTLQSLRGEVFDVVILSGTLHHLEIEQALPTLAQMTANRGRLLMWEPMGTNPVLNLFRFLTPNLRSQDEHPLTFQDLNLIRRFFPKTHFQHHTLTALAAVPLAMAPSPRIQEIGRKISFGLGKIDALLGKCPIIKRLHWIVLVDAQA